jgi:hypothetical protein
MEGEGEGEGEEVSFVLDDEVELMLISNLIS